VTAKLLRAHASRCDLMLANSQSVAEDARALFPARSRVQTVHNAIDLVRFRPEGPSLNLDAMSGLSQAPAGTVRVGLIGTFGRWKGHDVFLRALGRLAPSTPVRAYIVGAPIYETVGSQFSVEELKTLAHGLGIGARVGFTGRTDDVPAVIRALDVVVHASTEPEPFGMVIAEAMACGKPIVVSRAGGAAEIATAGAVFHTPGDASQLASAISLLAGNSAERASLGTAGRKAAERQFSRTRLAEQLIPIYEGLRR
jgi:glycosyltransferase involved in cell wall biosynthesis